jgi:cell division septum initiation protein DivIVA
LASEQFENAKSQVSILASGTQKPAHESILSMIEKAYSDSVDAASDRLHYALQYTDSIKSYAAGPTQGYFESVSSIASSRLSAGLSQASAQFSQPTGVSRQYYEAVGLAHARYSEFVGAASSAVYGPQQGTVESLASVASASAASIAAGISGSAQSVAGDAQSVAESIASQVSSGVIGSETPWSESIASQASVNWDAIIAKASDQVYGT